MFEIKGKYNTAKVFTDNIENEAVSQLTNLLNQEFVKDSKIRIMPDTHSGAGCVIGTTMTIKDKVVPNLVGVDIGCGMYAVKLHEKNIDLQKLDEVINKYIPSGFDIHTEPKCYSMANKIIAEIDFDRSQKSLGTLGGGNHFIEVDIDSNGDLWLVIHSGSRHLGVEVCKYYQNLAAEELKAQDGDIKQLRKNIVTRLTKEGRQKEISAEIEKLDAEYKAKKINVPMELAYLQGKSFDNYIHDMKITQTHARLNRLTMAEIIMEKMNLNYECNEKFDTIHNYIDTDNMILRKGSISAQLGEKVIIPMNMRDGSLICVGKGNPDWNYSAPHGAGRLMSRSRAKEVVSIEAFKNSMNGIYSTSVGESTIDEAPQVYKPMSEIVENIKDTVDIVDIIKPIYNFKAH